MSSLLFILLPQPALTNYLYHWQLQLGAKLSDNKWAVLHYPYFPYCLLDLLAAIRQSQTRMGDHFIYEIIVFQCVVLNILKGNVIYCVCGFTLNNCIIKHCALTPPTGHYNSDTSYNFSKASKCI